MAQPRATEPAAVTNIRCPTCDYNLAGLPVEARCPECGRPVWRGDTLRRPSGALIAPPVLGSVAVVASLVFPPLGIVIGAAALFLSRRVWRLLEGGPSPEREEYILAVCGQIAGWVGLLAGVVATATIWARPF